jgi:DNA repair protein RecN (Recombination protein N)
MLASLSIRDVVLIDRLDLTFAPHLSVLTGETGAGKSILLDAMGLALGSRAEAALVRPGAAQAVVVAEFEIGPNHAALTLLRDQGIEPEDRLVLRRVLNADGRSRGFVNDQPVGVGFLRALGETLVEIQGQFEQHGLLDPATHRGLIDAFGGAAAAAASVRRGWEDWRAARAQRLARESAISEAAREQEWLRFALQELDRINPREGEEAELAAARTRLTHRAQIDEALAGATTAVSGERGAEQALNSAARLLERVREKAGTGLDEAIAALERALVETAEAAAQIAAAAEPSDAAEGSLDAIEERIHALRGLARKHGIPVDGLAAFRADAAARLTAIEEGDVGLRRLAAAESEARGRYLAAAEVLSGLRRKASVALDRAIAAELPPLKLDRARFESRIERLDEVDWGPDGVERIGFTVATNPGATPGPLARIASGGELSRLLLALKVVLARVGSVRTIVFDEVDAGIGGAVAAAVGERLARLALDLQVLVVTHSPQVAARGAHHWRVAKKLQAGRATTLVEALNPAARAEEIARMLSGAEITDEARAAARRLIDAGSAAA